MTAAKRRVENALCSMPDCSELPRHGQRYCAECHSNYMRAWRAKRRADERALRASLVALRQRVVLQKQEISELRDGDT